MQHSTSIYEETYLSLCCLFFAEDCLSEAQIRYMNIYLQKENIQLQCQLTSRDQKIAQLQQELEEQSKVTPHAVDVDLWNVPRGCVQVSYEIGRGGWGVVVQGIYNSNNVAVKIPHKYLLSQRLLDQLKRVTRIMIQAQHPNLIRIIATVFDQASDRLTEPPWIITELLDTNLRKCYEQGRLQETSRIPVFLDVAYGLHYLHDRQEPIIHRNVSAPNILLKALPNGMWRAKLSDFDSANLARLSYTPSEDSPQTALHTLHATKIDVHSFGTVMCEVIAAEEPAPDLYLDSWLFDRLQQVRRMSISLYTLIVRCTNQSPEKRPTMAIVIDDLNKISL